MDSDNNRPKSLPDGWVLCKSKSSPGRKYYFNKRTGKSSWTQPQADKQLKPAPSANNKTKNKIDRIFNQKNRKEEPNKTVKRKSDGCESGSLKKKQKQDVIPEKQNASTSRPIHPSPCKRPASEQSKSSPSKRTPTKEFYPKTTPSKSAKVTPTKNLAQSRLNQLRTRLSAEAQQETQANTSIDQSPKKLSPPSQNDTPKSKAELKSPVVTETKCSTAQSPSSDSLQSMPSPSQFFAANKIISSMKAQLQEEYCDKLKPKDTFADIEKGIYDQTAEYPYSKHPATPPQFTEASKLVSAINSKLTKGVKDGDIKVYKSASDRLEALCTRLSKDMNESGEVTDIANEGSFLCKSTVNISSNEDMEVEEFRETSDPVQNVNKDIPESTQVDVGSNEQVVLVVDTNIFIHELDAIKTILNSHIKGYNEQPNLLVPWRVINELDRLKDNNNGNGAICKRAKAAMDYLYKSLPENNRIKGQSLRDANCHIYPCEIPDDEILNCCLQQAERKKSVILLSKDKNLCNKAAINNIKCIELGTLKARLVAVRAPARADAAALAHAVANAHHLLAYILENEMRAKYNNLWQHVIFKAPPWTLLDVLDCLLKHWLAVFNEVFPRIQHLITEMKNTLSAIESKDQKNVTESEVVNFKELCLDVAKKCQIIPEYMELAKVTADRLSRRGGARATRAGGGETDVVDAFERLWTVFSSYCAKLSTGVGVPHSLEDKLPGNDSVVVLVGKWQIFRGQVSALTNAIEGALRADTLTNEQLGALESAFKDSLALVGMDSATVYVDNLRQFCTKCRNMLQEAYTKFAQLTELLDVCKNNFVNN